MLCPGIRLLRPLSRLAVAYGPPGPCVMPSARGSVPLFDANRSIPPPQTSILVFTPELDWREHEHCLLYPI